MFYNFKLKMGCNLNKQDQVFIPIQENDRIANANIDKYNIPKQSNGKVGDSTKITATTSNKSQIDWQQFPDKQKALKLLLKNEHSISDLEFLLLNRIWKEQWFIKACQQFDIPMKKNKKFEASIMVLFLSLQLRQAKLSKSDIGNGIFCPECYNAQILSYKIDQSDINHALFEECDQCHSVGWIKGSQAPKKSIKEQNCQKCQQVIEQYSNQVQCPKCNAIGYKWIGQ